MNGWIDAWTSEWMDGNESATRHEMQSFVWSLCFIGLGMWMHGWIDGWASEWKDGWMDGWWTKTPSSKHKNVWFHHFMSLVWGLDA
jgi:hypothetical protein